MGYLSFCFRSFQLVEMREHWDQHIYGDENKLLGYWDFHGLDSKYLACCLLQSVLWSVQIIILKDLTLCRLSNLPRFCCCRLLTFLKKYFLNAIRVSKGFGSRSGQMFCRS